MAWEQTAIRQTLFGPGIFTKKAQKPVSYDPVTHLGKKFVFKSGQYTQVDWQTKSPEATSPEKVAKRADNRKRSRIAKSGEFVISQSFQSNQEVRYAKNRKRVSHEVNPITGLPVNLREVSSLYEDKTLLSLHESLNLGYPKPEKIAGALKRHVPSVAYVDPFTIP